MACFHPIEGWRSPDGKIRTSRDKQVYIDLPPIRIACGRCTGCRLERSRQWALRIMHETTLHQAQECWFLTLTYDDLHLPENENLELRDWQLFAKRWRKNHGKFRYYAVGEYGGQTGRPHYHACVWGMKFGVLETLGKSKKGNDNRMAPELESTWGKGRTAVGSLTWQSASYVARYIMDKKTGNDAPAHYQGLNLDTGEIFERVPEFSVMSRRPGIGHDWHEKYTDDVYQHDQVPVRRGVTSRPPKYYDKTRQELEAAGLRPPRFQSVAEKRKQAAEKWNRKNGPERLAVKENQLKRRLAKPKGEI